MSANIQFMEIGNLLSPDKGDIQDFLCHPVLSGAWGGRWPVVVGRLRGAPGAYR